ncbi:MAG: 5' nucleotidase, NT5C type [Acidimicrobiales bacterium]|jgi:5'-nucleotidase
MSGPFILGVDLDGVVANHTSRFREIVADINNVPIETYPMERSWDFHEWGFGPDEYSDYHRVAVLEYDMFATMPVIEGAAEALWRLSDAGVWIRIVTHRLYVNWGHGAAVGQTAQWLEDNRIPYRDLCFLGDKPEVQADAYIDDAVHNITKLRNAGNTVITFDQPYNRDLEGLRAKSWQEVEEIVTQLAARHTGAIQTQLPGIDAGVDRVERRRQLGDI